MELVDGGEEAVLGSVVEDSLGQDRTHAGKGVQLAEGGGVEVDGNVGGCAGRGCGGGARGGGGTGWRGDAYEDLFAVGDWAREVEGGEVHTGEWAAGEGEYVGYAGAGGRFDEAGVADLAGYMYDDQAGG